MITAMPIPSGSCAWKRRAGSKASAAWPAYEHEALIPVRYERRDGKYHLNGAPGLGVAIDEKIWNATY